MNVYLIPIIIALNVGYYYLTNWLGKKDLPKPEPHQTLINLTNLNSARLHFFGVTITPLLTLIAGKIDAFGFLAFYSLFVLFGLGVNLGMLLNPDCGYLLFDDKLIIFKKSLISSPVTFDWQSLQKFGMPYPFCNVPKKIVLTAYGSFEYLLVQDFFLFKWLYFDKNTNEALKLFHQKVVEAIETNKNTEEL